MSVLIRSALTVTLAVATVVSAACPAGAQFLRIRPGSVGNEFPKIKASPLNLDEPDRVVALDLETMLTGKRTVLYYWIPKNVRSESVMVELQTLVDGTGGLEVYTVTAPSGRLTRSDIAERMRMLRERGVRFPVLVDDGFQMAQALGVMTVPDISVIGEDRVLRLKGAKSLRQPVGGGRTVADYLRAAAKAESLRTIEDLEPYYPATELVGKRYEDFRLPVYGDEGTRVALSERVGPGKVTGVFFWSPTCPHCKDALPSLREARKRYPDRFDLVSVTQLPTPKARKVADDVIAEHGIDFPILLEEGEEASVWGDYNVVSTPTTFLIGPEGVIQAVHFLGSTDYADVVGEAVGRIGGDGS